MTPIETKETTEALGHLAFCALVALALARQQGKANTPYAEHLFVIRWLATAEKQRRFPRQVAIDIAWLLKKGRQQGPNANLRQRLEYLWQSCTGELAEQSALFRLTFAIETLKEQGWDNGIMTLREWESGLLPIPPLNDGVYIEKQALTDAFTQQGAQCHPLECRVIGDVQTFLKTMADSHLHAECQPAVAGPYIVHLLPSEQPGMPPDGA